MQLCTGIDDNSVGACFQLIFAQIDELFPDDAPLLSSGFRVIPLDGKSVKYIARIICCTLFLIQLIAINFCFMLSVAYLSASLLSSLEI